MVKNIIYFILALLSIIILNLTINSTDLFYLLIVITLYLMFISSFKHLKYTKKSSNQILSIIIWIILINIVYFAITYIICSIFFTQIKPIFISMALSIFILPSIRIILNYLSNLGLKKKCRIIKLMFYSTNIITIISLLVLYHFINLDINIFGTVLFLSNFIPIILTFIYQRKIFKNNQINLKEVKPIFYRNIKSSILVLSNLAYYYLSLIFLYFSFTHKYLYDNSMVSTLLIDVYLCHYFIIIIFSYIFYPKENNNININNFCIKIVRKMLPLTIFISILSGPILMLLFGNNTNAYILTLLIFESIFLVIYNACMQIIIDKKKFSLILSIGIIIKCLISIPLINSLYRMGYSMIYGDIISTMLSLLVPILIVIVYYNNVNKIKFDDYFNDIINIIYENIILCLILILLQLILPLTVQTRLLAFLVIIVYAIVYLVFIYIKKIFGRSI